MPNAKKLAIQKTGAKGEGVSGWWCAAEQENQSSIASNLDMAPRTKFMFTAKVGEKNRCCEVVVLTSRCVEVVVF
jgi:hypothetical protein